MYKSGQIVFDNKIDEPVIFVEGDGDGIYVVCLGVKDSTAMSRSMDIEPIWDKNNHVFSGKFVARSFTKIFDVNKGNYKKYAEYIEYINRNLKEDGKNDNKLYHTKG